MEPASSYDPISMIGWLILIILVFITTIKFFAAVRYLRDIRDKLYGVKTVDRASPCSRCGHLLGTHEINAQGQVGRCWTRVEGGKTCDCHGDFSRLN